MIYNSNGNYFSIPLLVFFNTVTGFINLTSTTTIGSYFLRGYIDISYGEYYINKMYNVVMFSLVEHPLL